MDTGDKIGIAFAVATAFVIVGFIIKFASKDKEVKQSIKP